MIMFIILMFLSSRVAALFWWAINPDRWERAFNDSIVWPILGIVFMPLTTLMWVAVVPYGNPDALDIFFVALAVLADLGNLAGGAAKRHDAPGYPAGY